ncbi:CrcB family protein [Brevibacterium sp. Marseille-P9724]|uniref:CrcB family protein n=1 Tax=Brevibacterium sp. Marseille-P9724 TaxID=2614125 RepID=UPI00125FE6AB|nr:CrcB family protein [Brevibacterium sp. Marseille-P9724]
MSPAGQAAYPPGSARPASAAGIPPAAGLFSRTAAVFLGGAVGTAARAGLGILLDADWAVLIANTLACGLLAFICARPSLLAPHSPLRLGLGTGLAGALSSTSAIAVHSFLTGSAVYPLLSATAGLVAVAVGIVIGKRFERSS